MTSASISPNYVDEFRAEKFSLSLCDIHLMIILIVELSEFLLTHFLTNSKRISNFFCGFHFSSNCDELSKDRAEAEEERETKREKRHDRSISRGEVDVVLKRLGMFSNDGGAKLPESFDADDIFELFEEENPSLGEVKEAFDVFDEDRDGFIDAEELQKVLEALGIKEGLKLENCREMIAEVDDNGDGRIDFDEFVRFMERSLC